MEEVNCPYCSRLNHTSAPESMVACAYCGHMFAEVRTPYQRTIVLDRHYPSAWTHAQTLMARWAAAGEEERQVIVDRRLGRKEFQGRERRGNRVEAERIRFRPR
ncbi:MAG: hypothetical protein ACYCXF_04820 [Thermoleophilia bacterium]